MRQDVVQHPGIFGILHFPQNVLGIAVQPQAQIHAFMDNIEYPQESTRKTVFLYVWGTPTPMM